MRRRRELDRAANHLPTFTDLEATVRTYQLRFDAASSHEAAMARPLVTNKSEGHNIEKEQQLKDSMLK